MSSTSVGCLADWPSKRTAVSGSREGHPQVERWMQAWWTVHGPSVWVLGGARGVDMQARKLCDLKGWPYIELRAQWEHHGRSAGHRRNRDMLAWSVPDGVLLAFPRGGPGTRNCIGLFEEHGRFVYIAKEPQP